jgi:8-oxo-dGTP pyrophosphatase MutT (NUDIX family)
MSIRPKAVCVCRRGGEILVNAAFDSAKQETFYGPLGGGVEFGERAADAATRELQEELGAAVTDLTLLGVLENIFVYEGQPGHEIVFVFDGRLVDRSLYDRIEISCEESNGQRFVAQWVPIEKFAGGGLTLYPAGLHALLSSDLPD